MSIFDDLARTKVTEQETIELGNILYDYNLFCGQLNRATYPDDVLKMLKLELLGQNRPSYVNRLYGRYRKLLPERDKALMYAWRKHERESSRKVSDRTS